MPDSYLADKKCLITGAASGIGKALAVQCAAQGATVFLTDIDRAGLDTTVDRIRAAGHAVGHAEGLDIADYEAVKQFAKTIHDRSASMDLVMNVAGIAVWGRIENLRHEHWRKTIDINLMGPIHVMECFVPPMIAAGRGGHLVNVASAAGLFGLPWHAAYSASKFGVRGVSEVLRYDLERHGIVVSLVCPGGVDTGLVDTVEIVGLDKNQPDLRKLTQHFRKRAVTPDRAAAVILAGVRKNRYMIFTSPDIWLGHWFQQRFAWPYEWVMRKLNDRLNALAAAQQAREHDH